jgi:hypothetical protein
MVERQVWAVSNMLDFQPMRNAAGRHLVKRALSCRSLRSPRRSAAGRRYILQNGKGTRKKLNRFAYASVSFLARPSSSATLAQF